MRCSRVALNFSDLKEIHLQNSKFTWSNVRQRPTLVRLDCFFINEGWDLAFPDHTLHALSSMHSDHCPLLLALQSGPRRPNPFKFENFWTKLPQFMQMVQAAWNDPTSNTKPFHRLRHKLYATTRMLRSWRSSIISNAKLKLLMAQQVILLHCPGEQRTNRSRVANQNKA